jgi:hypothetical protein
VHEGVFCSKTLLRVRIGFDILWKVELSVEKMFY